MQYVTVAWLLSDKSYNGHMRKLTCKELGGACDAIITGNTPEEMGENSKKHAMEMFQQGDANHIAAMEKMKEMKPQDFQSFWHDFVKRFESAEEI